MLTLISSKIIAERRQTAHSHHIKDAVF